MDFTPFVAALCLQDELDMARTAMADETGDAQAAARATVAHHQGELMSLANAKRRAQPIMVLP